MSPRTDPSRRRARAPAAPPHPGASFRAAVHAVVRLIPPGRVMSYGQVALVAGLPRAARAVGGALHLLAGESDVPWHRVVNRHGLISTRCPEHSMWLQAERLRAEGVLVDPTLQLDIDRYRWWPDRAALADLRLAPEILAALDAYIARAERWRDE